MKNIKAIRLKDYDYSTNGYYFVTICCDYKQPHLARLEGIVKEAVEGLNVIKGVKIDYFCHHAESLTSDYYFRWLCTAVK